MIKSFRHKGLKAFYETGSTRGIRADHARRLQRLLTYLDVASAPGQMDHPGFRLHPLKGELAGFWAVDVSGNWRLIFRFIEADVELVDYLDYH